MSSGIVRPPPASPTSTIRSLTDADHAALLRLNADNYPEVHRLNETDLRWFLGFGGHHLVAIDPTGAVLGYLLSHASTTDYDDTEIVELRRRVTEPFLYVCQVVIARERRGRGIGRALYAEIVEIARRQDVRLLCCDVNTDPPNPASLAFHCRLGFTEISRGTASNGFAIAFLGRRV